jgi:hypothetical protein
MFHNLAIDSTCGNSLASNNSNNTCTIATNFGPAQIGDNGDKNAIFNISYSPYSGSATKHTSDVALNGRVTAAPSAFFGMAVTSSDFHSGNATQNNPYQGYTNTDYQINAVYTNNSMVTANSFTTNPISNTNFSLTSHGCNGNQGAMAHNATCTDRYTLNINNAGDYNLDLTNTTASWADSSGTYTNVPISGAKIYTSTVIH